MFVSRFGIRSGIGVLLGAAVVVGMSWPAASMPAQGRTADLQGARHFSARLAVRHRRFPAPDTLHGRDAPDVVMRLTREFRAGRWQTTLAVERPPDLFVDLSGGRAPVRNPFLITRVELNDDEDEPRMYDQQGRRVRAMSMADLPVLGAAGTLRRPRTTRGDRATAAVAWLAESGRQAERRDAIVRAFGPAVGRTRGLDRYVTQTTTGRQEVLVTPDTALPVELRSAVEGAEVQTDVTYEPYGPYGYVRRFMRSEHRFSAAAAGRTVTEVELSNVVISGEVAP